MVYIGTSCPAIYFQIRVSYMMKPAFTAIMTACTLCITSLVVNVAMATTAVASETDHRIFQLETKPELGKVVSSSATELCDVARGTVDYLNLGEGYDTHAITAGITAQFGGGLARVKRTLNFVCQVDREDRLAGNSSRLLDAGFIAKHFDVIRWMPDKVQAKIFSNNKPLLKNIPNDKILLTKYYIKLAKGSAVKTPETPYALYALPFDEQGLSLEVANDNRALTRHKLTKQAVLTGVLDNPKLAEPLVWLSRYDLEDSLMQGTVNVEVNGNSQFYNVHRNNGIAYDRNLKRREQGRYWYFKQTDSVMGYGKDASRKIPVHPMVTVAGDLAHLGLGKLILLTVNGQSRLTILADTGGAFANNQYQLDYLGGYFKNWQDYINTYRNFPDYVEARILLLKQ